MSNLATRTIPRIRAKSVCVLWEFGNSLVDGVSVATLQGYTNEFAARVTAAGGLPVFGTVPARSDVVGGNETNRIAYNTWLASAYPNNCARLDNMLQLANTGDPNYFTDGIHPSDAGCRLIGDELATTVLSVRKAA